MWVRHLSNSDMMPRIRNFFSPEILLQVFHHQKLVAGVEEGPATKAPSGRGRPWLQLVGAMGDKVCVPRQHCDCSHVCGKQLTRQP